jgi:hypothetical protein
MELGGKHRKARQAVFEDPVRSNLVWADVEKLFGAQGLKLVRDAVRGSAFTSAVCGWCFTVRIRRRRRTRGRSGQCGGS